MRDRQAVDEVRGERIGRELCALPARMGGLGVYSHKECAPHAHASAAETADILVDSIFGLEGLEERMGARSQKERCGEMWAEKADRLLDGLGDWERKTVIDNSTTLGRRWLNTIPYFQPLRLSDYEISTGLHLRTPASGCRPVCLHCGAENSTGPRRCLYEEKQMDIQTA